MNETENEEKTQTGSSCWNTILVVGLSIGTFFKTCAGCFKAGSAASKVAVTGGKIAVGTGSAALIQQEQQAAQTARELKPATIPSTASSVVRETERKAGKLPPAEAKPPPVQSKIPMGIRLEQQTTAEKLVKENLSFKVYNSVGKEIGVVTSKLQIEQVSTQIASKVLNSIQKTKLTNPIDLNKLVESIIKQEQLTHGKMLIFNVTTGELQLNLESNSTKIEGTINMYNTILKAVGLGAGGYYILNKKDD